MKTKADLLNDFTNWIQETIDSWVQSSDDCYPDMAYLRENLNNANEYFHNEFDEFTEEYGYENKWLDIFENIISNYVESTKHYLKNSIRN